MKKKIILIIMLIITSCYATATETTTETEKKTPKQTVVKKRWNNINNTLAYHMLKNLPDYPILHSPEIIAEVKKRFHEIRPLLISIATNLLIRTYFNIGYDFQLIYFLLGFLACDSMSTVFKPFIDQDVFCGFLAISLQTAMETFLSCYVITDSYNTVNLSKKNITLIPSFIIACTTVINLYYIASNKKILSDYIPHPRLMLLNKLVKKNIPMFLYSEDMATGNFEKDKLFIKINRWLALHKEDISLYNLFSDHSNILKQEAFNQNDQIAQKINNYHIVSYEKQKCINLKLWLAFTRQPSDEKVNQADIAKLLHQEGQYIIEANKDIENYDISNDLLKDKHQYIAIINCKSSHYLLVGFQVTSNSVATRLANKLLWPTLLKNIPYNKYITLSIKFKTIEELMNAIEDIVACFEECNSRMGIYKLVNINKEAFNKVYGLKKPLEEQE